MEALIEKALENLIPFKSDHPCLVGVSGGPDSICLMTVLKKLGIPQVVAHFDHHLRQNSSSQAEELRQIVAQFGLPFVLGEGDVVAYAQQNRQTIEEAARTLRYQFLFQTAENVKAQAVIVGHTADDQVETILMHLLRGSGVAGLGGMQTVSAPNPWSTSIPLIRPMLGIWRDDVLAYLNANHLHSIIDESNQDLRYFRNRLRHELIPLLEMLNPGASRLIWQTGVILAAENTTLATLADQAWAQTFHKKDNAGIFLKPEVFQAQPLAIQRRMIRRALMLADPNGEFSFGIIERVRRFFLRPTRTYRLMPGGNILLELESGFVRLSNTKGADISDNRTPSAEPIEIRFRPGDQVELPSGWCLYTQIQTTTPDLITTIRKNADYWQAWVDADRLPGELTIRTRQIGERFRPLGMGGQSIKISDYMINRRFPRRLRNHWPVVAAGATLIWVPNGTISDEVAIGEWTERVLHLKLVPGDEGF